MFVAEITLKIHENIAKYMSRKYSPKIVWMIIQRLLYIVWSDKLRIAALDSLGQCSIFNSQNCTFLLFFNSMLINWSFMNPLSIFILEFFLYPKTLERYQKFQNYSFSLVESKYLYWVRPKTLHVLKKYLKLHERQLRGYSGAQAYSEFFCG